LGAAQLNATANVSGTFTYNPPAGTLYSTPGSFGLNVSFAPVDSADYAPGSGSVTLTVVTATLSPGITNSNATSVTANSATLTSLISPNSSDTHAWFLYGTSSTLSGAILTPSQNLGSGGAAVNITASLSGLTANTTYYYQAVALNSAGTTSGPIQSFVTPTASAYTVSGSAVTLSKGATSGDTSTIVITPSGGFSGTVTLSASVTASPSGAQELPTFSWTPSNAQVALSGSSAATATLTILTTSSTAAANQRPANPAAGWYGTSGAVLACVALFWIPSRRRALRNMLTIVALFVAIGGGLLACGSGSKTVGGGGGNPGTTSGSYTITVTATSGATSVTTPITLTVQ
jgi:hypothetical protein